MKIITQQLAYPDWDERTTCDSCRYLGTITDSQAEEEWMKDHPFDLFICGGKPAFTRGGQLARHWTLIARFGEAGDYLSGASFANPTRDGGPMIPLLHEAGKLAIEMKLLTQAQLDAA